MVEMSRRSFIGRTAATAVAASASTAVVASAGLGTARADVDPHKPNILVIIVDEMRAPQWFPPAHDLSALLPNIARIGTPGVTFDRFYTAATMCTPARATMVTGLYTHQTGCMLVNQSTLSPEFPTWGSLVSARGYQAWWYGKWHLGHTSDTTPGGLAAYGFSGGTYPSPNGSPNQGLHVDPAIAGQFVDWFGRTASDGPWCTTVSFVNPHDIQWWPRWTHLVQQQTHIPRVITSLPPNFETPDQLKKRKPGLQSALRQVGDIAFGVPRYSGPEAAEQWIAMQNLYLWYQRQVDVQIGRVLDALATRPEVAANTVVVFTADHGDYAGSHGLHGKGGAAYEESIRVPLMVHDPRGLLTPTGGGSSRSQLVSSVDLTPFILTIATGGDAWRGDPHLQHLARRADIAAICRDPGATGRPWIAHTTDEHTIEEGALVFDGDAPAHVVAVRTATAKFAEYSHWKHDSIDIDHARVQEHELYDYRTRQGVLEIDNLAHRPSSLQPKLSALLASATSSEINEPLPAYLLPAQQAGFADYHKQVSMVANPFG